MEKELRVGNKKVNLYCTGEVGKELTVVILNTFQNEGQEVFRQCLQNGSSGFLLAAISGIDWNHEMTPWYLSKSDGGGTEYLGLADAYLKTLEEELVLQIRDAVETDWKWKIHNYVIAGYSLAGLFALYSAHKTDLFAGVVSTSGSFWYPGFLEFVRENEMSPSVEKIYFSLGNKEGKARNRMFREVLEHTKEIEKICRARHIKTIYEENEGNHFRDTTLRMAKGISWIVK